MTEQKQGRRAERTRLRLLEAGLALLRDDRTERLFEVVSPRRVIAQAESSSGAFYHHFSGQDSYLDQLLDYSLADSPNPDHRVSVEALESALAGGASLAEAIIAGGAAALRFADTDTSVPLQLFVRAKASRDPVARSRLFQMYELVTAEMASYYDEVLEVAGRELRPPYTPRDLVAAILVLYEGLSLRRTVERDVVPDESLGRMIIAVLELYTRPIGDRVDRDEWITRIGDHWAAQASDPNRRDGSTRS